MADEYNNIKFTARWEEIKPLSNEEVVQAAAELPLVALVGNVCNSKAFLLAQSVNGEAPTYEPLTIQAGDTISYTVKAGLSDEILAHTNMSSSFNCDFTELLRCGGGYQRPPV